MTSTRLLLFEQPMTDTAYVRIGHCSPDAPGVDILVDGERAFEDIAFETVTEYATLPAGSHEVAVTAHGDDQAVIEATLELAADASYTVFATGTLAEGDLQAIVLTDEDREIAAESAHVRFVHCSPDAPAVDVRVADGGPTLFEDVAFRGNSEYAPVDAGTYDLEVVPSGDDDVALSVPGLELGGGMAYSAVAIGTLADSTLSAILLEDARRVMTAGN
jgi:hypothetical protein